MSSAVEQLLEAARFIEMQELRQKRQYKISAGCTPPDSPVTIGNHYSVHNIDCMNLNTTIVRTKEPFLKEHTVAPPLVVISSQNHPIHSLTSSSSLTAAAAASLSSSSHSLDASRCQSTSSSSSSSLSTSTLSSTNPITANGVVQHVLTNGGGEDSSQSSLNLSNGSSGYLTGSSANTSLGVVSTLNLSGTQTGSVLLNGTSPSANVNGSSGTDCTNAILSTSHLPQITSSRRRTISSNSNGADTREVHNKLEKNRRAHLKDCFEQLKKELPYQEEKKTSNLSILGNAFKTVQSLKLKERELEHEMERLAKEKVAQQKKILILKRELSQHLDHTDSSFLLPESDGISGSIRERFLSESLSEPSLPSSGRARYSSTSSLSSATTVSSPCTTGAPAQSTITFVSSANTSPSSPQRACSASPTTTIPLSLISVMDSPQPLKLAQVIPNNLTNGLTHNGNHIAINFTTSDGISSALLTPNTTPATSISLNGTAAGLNQSLQIISTSTNPTNKMFGSIKPNNKNGIRNTIIEQSPITHHNLIGGGPSSTIKDGTTTKVELLASNMETTEPPAKVIKLINGSIALAPVVDKDGKLLSSNSLTLSQVVVPLRVNGQTANSLATIELTQRNNNNHANGTQLHKLLVGSSSTTANITSVNTVLTTTSTPVASELARLPGGAELNILPAGTNSTTSLYRSNGKLTAIVNNGFSFKDFIGAADGTGTNGRAVHMVTPIQSNATPISGLTPIVVSQDQNGTNLTHIIASSQQLAGKVVTAPLSVNGHGLPIMGTQYLSSAMVKPMVVTVAANANGQTAATVQNASISLPITTAATSNSGLV